LIDISVTISPIRDAGGKITGASKVARDITERKRLEKEILEISDRERRRIGHDLHDGLCQHLAGIELMSQVLEQKLARRSKAAADRAGDIAKNVREAIGQTRAAGARPFARHPGIGGTHVRVAGAGAEHGENLRRRLPVRCDRRCWYRTIAAATHLFRLAQEAVSNAIKHGRAKRISIRLKEDRGRMILSVIDNGSGFPEKLPKSKGMGLRIMRSRAGMIGGTLAFERNAGGGASVTCHGP
jgi:two-component system, LuxR family, sensor kinase FixL